MKNLKYFVLTIGLFITTVIQLSAQGCDPQLTSVNIINRPAYCVTNAVDFVELEMAWAMGGGNPACVAPTGSWRVQVNMPLSFVYKVNSAADVTMTGPFTWTYDGVNNLLRGTNNVPIPITSSGLIKIRITGNSPATTTCLDVTSVANIEIVPNILGGSTASFNNEIDNDSGSFYLESRAPMVVTAGSIATCYDNVAAAEAAAIAATTATTTCSGTVNKTASTSGTCSAVITVTATNDCGDIQMVTYNTRIDNTAPVFTCLSNQTRNAPLNQCTYTVSGTEFDATATDNCPGTITYGYVLTGVNTGTGTTLAGVVLNKGVTTVTWTATDGCGKFSTCQFTVTVSDTQLPTISCPANVTVDLPGDRDPYVTGLATAMDNCAGVVVTYTENRAGLTGCNATGIIVRTFTATDASGNTATCAQNISVMDTVRPVLVCPPSVTVNTDPGLCTAVVNYSTVAIDSAYAQGFEDPGYYSGANVNASSDWNNYNSVLSRAATGTGGITSKSGLAHGVINSAALPAPPNDFSGVFTRLGGYSPVFGNGFKSSVDVYVDLSDPGVAASTYGYDISSAVSNQSNNHLRDFVFHTSSIGGQVWVAASNGTNFTKRNDIAGGSNYNITATGWYTYEWTFRNSAGALAVDLKLKNAGGTTLWTSTLSNPADLIATVVGGNRYMWFTFISPLSSSLAIDNSYLERSLPVSFSVASGTAFALGANTVTAMATDACNNTKSCSFTVTVVDNQNPVITVCAPNQNVNLNATCGLVVPDLVALTTATDNCSVTVTQSPTAGTILPSSHNQTHVITITATDAALNAVTCNTTLTGKDVTNPVIACPVNVILNCEDSRLPASTGTATASDNCAAPVVVTYTDTALPPGACTNSFVINRLWTATDGAGNTDQCTQTLTIQDVSAPIATAPPARTLEGCSTAALPEAKAITLSPVQAANSYYPDRYAPAGFVVQNFLGSDRLKHSINAADCDGCRPPAYNGGFYNTQGRKLDTPGALSQAIDLYVPAAWATTNKRMAGLWGTGIDNTNAVSAYAIIEFTSDGGVPRFRAWDNGVWIDLGLPAGFVYDSWVTLNIRLVGTQILYRVGNLTLAVDGLGTVSMADVILQGHNTATPGVTYDIYWDNFKTLGVNLPYSAAPVAITASQYAAEGGSATDKCPGAVTISYADTQLGTCPIVITRTFTITDACGLTTTTSQTITIQDTQAPVVAGSLTPQVLEACGVPAAVTTVAALEALPGNLTITDCNADGLLTVTSSDVVSGSCPTVVTRTYTVKDPCLNTAVAIVQSITYDDNILPLITAPQTRTLEGCSTAALPEAKAIALSPVQAANSYYPDRYAPAGFVVQNFLGSDRLKHSINAADCDGCRPPAYNGGFYNTQGRKLDTPGALSQAIDLYVPAAWATTNKRMAGLWGTGIDNTNAVSAYAIIEFTSDGGVPRFRAWDNGVWIDLGLPAGFVYDSWVTLNIRLVGTQILYRVGNLTLAVDGLGTVSMSDVILQGHNTATPGVTYDIYWDNFKTLGVNLPYSVVPVSITASQYAAEGGSATDNCVGPVSISYTDATTLATCPAVVVINRTFTVTDACGNTASTTQVINIQDTQAPVVTTLPGALDATLQCSNLAGIASALTLSPSATDACTITKNLISDVTTPGACPQAYTRVRTWNFTDACNTSASYVQTITVIDNTPPVITCKTNTTRNANANVCTYTAIADEFDITAVDNCSATVSYSWVLTGATTGSGATTLAGVLFNQGVTTVTWTATDPCSNGANCAFTVTVNDTQAPTLASIPATGAAIAGYTCGQMLTFNTDPNACSASKTIVKPLWADNCSILSSTATANNGVILSDYGAFVSANFPVGITTVTFIGTDNALNTTTCTLMIEVKDMTAPIIVNCPSNISVMAPVNACSAIVVWSPPPTAFDNCSGVTLVQTSSPTVGLGIGSQFPIGVTTILYTATDASGNTATCTFTVTVTGTCANQTEFTTTFIIDAANFNINQSRDGIFTVDNISANPNNTPVSILINKPFSAFFSFSIPALSFNANVFGGILTNNSDWNILDVGFAYLCTTKAGVVIAPGQSSLIGVTYTANGPSATSNSQVQTTGQIVNNSGGDQNSSNNFTQSTLIIN